MRNRFFIRLFLLLGLACEADTLELSKPGKAVVSSSIRNIDSLRNSETTNIYRQRLQFLDEKTPMDLAYNEKVLPFIESYIGRNKLLVSRMKGLQELYFPLFEQHLDKHELPLELKYLAIVESALNPKAKSYSGATGLWQFMYLTGKEYGLQVNSYIDDRQDPLKSTQAACEYFLDLYEIFGDWNLVLAAYNLSLIHI